MPIFSVNVVGSLFCDALVEGRPAQAVVYSGSTLTFLSHSRSFESGTDGSNKKAEILPPGTAVFADIDDDDGLEDKEEMWLPSKASLENKWPFEEDFESTVLNKLCIGPQLSLEQRVQLLNVCR
jgi:hypothetical protein